MIKTKSLSEPISQEDGYRILVTRYRPRGVKMEEETWNEWDKSLAPSKELHAAWYGKHGLKKIDWIEYKRRYISEMKNQKDRIGHWAIQSKNRTITLLCFCKDESRCHRILLKDLIEKACKVGL